MTPSYIKNIITPYIPTCSLRSEETYGRVVPMIRLEGFADRSFSKAAPSIYNNLSDDLRQCSFLSAFKRRIETSIFAK